MKKDYNFDQVFFDLSRSVDSLKIYAEIVQDTYQEHLGLKFFKQIPETMFFDNNAVPIVVRIGDKIVGGTVLYFKRTGDPYKLPFEKDTGFKIEDMCQGLQRGEMVCEISRVCLLPEYRDRRMSIEILRVGICLAISRNCSLVPFVTYNSMMKNTKMILHKIGLDHLEIDTVSVPEAEIYEGIKMSLGLLDIRKVDFQKFLAVENFRELLLNLLKQNKSLDIGLEVNKKIAL